ncbi:hypothetical protein QCA50_018101 [Cerrena zonata]|uniref:Uncharacterized protein n=1 Tax=Cerrena zonata TaxID=2478898 RepID=A0AAW0FNK6_9APHY
MRNTKTGGKNKVNDSGELPAAPSRIQQEPVETHSKALRRDFRSPSARIREALQQIDYGLKEDDGLEPLATSSSIRKEISLTDSRLTSSHAQLGGLSAPATRVRTWTLDSLNLPI